MKYHWLLLFFIGLFSVTIFSQAKGQVDTSAVFQLIDEGKNLAKVGEYEQALNLLQKSDSLSNVLNFKEGMAKGISLKVDIYIDQNKIEEAHNLVLNALDQYPESEERTQFHNLLGTIYSYKEMEMRAVQEFEKAKEFLQRLPNDEKNRMEIALMQNLGVVYSNLGQHELAFEHYLNVIEQAEQVQDTSILTLAYNNIGEAYNTEKQLDRAQFYLEKALKLAEAQQNKMNIYRAHLNYANVLSNQEKYLEALEHYNKAEELFSEIRPGVPPAIILHNKGATLSKLERYHEAEELLNQSLQMCIESDIRIGIYFNYYVFGNMYIDRERYEEAINYLEKAADLSLNIPDINNTVNAFKALHVAYAGAGHYQDAYEALITFKTYSDSLSEINKSRELSFAENRIELSRQNEINRLLEEKQIQQQQRIQIQYVLIVAAVIIIFLIVALWLMARKRSREKEELLQELQNRKEELEELNKAKDRVFAVVSHDLRSPLTSVQGVLALVKDELVKGDELNYLIEGVDASLRKNVDVIEELLAWAKKQLSGFDFDIHQVELKPVIEDIISSQSFVALQKNIRLKLDISVKQTVYADVNAVRIIFRNLISNAIKYTNKGGKVEVQARDMEDKIRIAVSDDGMGIPEADKDKIFKSTSWTRVGTGNEKGTGFGLSLSKEFVEKMNGKIWFETEEGEGTTFFVELPKQK